MNLYKHNQEAYDAVMKHYAEGNKKAAIVHATGTGKSYIIGAVSEHFKKVLVIAPNNFVLDETRKVCHDGCEFRTYASVMYNEGERDLYDLIVLDEFHRGGAEKWGEGVRRLIEANHNSLLLGTSATHIRYLDNQRNMADELFDGNVVSHLPLKEAIDRRILPNPTYVSSIYTIDETVCSRKQKIEQCRKKNVDKEELCRRLEGIAHNWENAGGVPRIIRKYFTHDMQRVIVFCSKVARAAEARKLLSRWFGLAGFNRVRYYNIDYKETRLEREMKDFQEPLGDYDLKVAISVNMLNEGVHIPHVDGVIMLRSTVSRIIIEQQVGRCLTSNNVGINPVVIDLVNNMDMIQYDEPVFTGEFVNRENSELTEHNHRSFPFTVIDECRDFRILLKQLDSEIDHVLHRTLEDCRKIASSYKTRLGWYKGDSSSYACARRHGWLDECCSHMEKYNEPHTKEECILSASKYSSRRDWVNSEPALYTYAYQHGWFNECCAHMKKLCNVHTIEECKASASNYNRIIDWCKSDNLLYSYARKHGWIDKCCAHMKRTYNSHTKEECLESASRYKNKRDWKNAAYGLYQYASKRGWLDECCAHMEVLYHIGRTKEDCMIAALNYNSRNKWYINDRKTYDFACKHGWLDECCAHMVNSKTAKKKEI